MRTLLVAAAASLVATAAHARDLSLDGPTTSPAGVSHWSIATGETVSPARDALAFDLGWPGISLGYIHGLSDRSDVGLKFDFLYGFEGTTTTSIGFGLGVPLRLVAVRRDKISVMLHIDPGVRTYVTGFDTAAFGIRFPIGALLGVQVTPEFRLAAGVDLPLALGITPGPVQLLIGPAFGAAMEYYVDKDLLVGLNTRFGPLFSTAGGGGAFAFTTQVVVGYRL